MSSFDIVLGDYENGSVNAVVVTLSVTPTYVGYSVLTEDDIDSINRLVYEDLEFRIADLILDGLNIQSYEIDKSLIKLNAVPGSQYKPYTYVIVMTEVGNNKALAVAWDDNFDYGDLRDYITEKLYALGVDWHQHAFETKQFFHG